MAALTNDRNTLARDGDSFSFALKAAAKIFAGAIVCIDATGYLVRGSATPGLAAVGIAQERVDNSAGLDGALACKVRRGVWRLTNSGVNAVTKAHIGSACYMEDDQVVGSSPVGKSVAGVVVDLDAAGVWVDIGRLPYPSAHDAYLVEAVIPTAQVLTLNATPRALVAALGANKAFELVSVEVHKPAGTAYDGVAAGEDIAIKQNDASGAVLATIEATGFVDQATAQTRLVYPTATAAFTPVANAPLVAHMLTGEIATGTSDLKFRTRFRVIDLTW